MSNDASMSFNNYQKFKVVFLGDQAVGKSCVLARYVYDTFDQCTNSTIGVDFVVKTVFRDGKTYKIHFWDTAGQERFHSLIPSYIKNCQVAILVYDVTNRASFEHLPRWYQSVVEEKGQDIIVGVIGNKIDLPDRAVTMEEGLRYAEGIKALFHECSAKTGENIGEFLKLVCDTLVDSENEQAKFRDEGKGDDSFEKLTKGEIRATGKSGRLCC